MSHEYWSETVKALGPVLPEGFPLTEKLLSRPPYKYIHDIFTHVSAATGFGVGLLTAEEGNDLPKEARIPVIAKMLAAVETASGKALGVSPDHVVSGKNAEATNRFLYLLGVVAAKFLKRRLAASAVSDSAGAGEASRHRTSRRREREETAPTAIGLPAPVLETSAAASSGSVAPTKEERRAAREARRAAEAAAAVAAGVAPTPTSSSVKLLPTGELPDTSRGGPDLPPSNASPDSASVIPSESGGSGNTVTKITADDVVASTQVDFLGAGQAKDDSGDLPSVDLRAMRSRALPPEIQGSVKDEKKLLAVASEWRARICSQHGDMLLRAEVPAEAGVATMRDVVNSMEREVLGSLASERRTAAAAAARGGGGRARRGALTTSVDHHGLAESLERQIDAALDEMNLLQSLSTANSDIVEGLARALLRTR